MVSVVSSAAPAIAVPLDSVTEETTAPEVKAPAPMTQQQVSDMTALTAALVQAMQGELAAKATLDQANIDANNAQNRAVLANQAYMQSMAQVTAAVTAMQLAVEGMAKS